MSVLLAHLTRIAWDLLIEKNVTWELELVLNALKTHIARFPQLQYAQQATYVFLAHLMTIAPDLLVKRNVTQEQENASSALKIHIVQFLQLLSAH